MEYYQIIAGRVSMLCKQRGISISELARMSNIRQQTLNSIIHGASKDPQMKTIHKVANALGMTLSEFVDFPELNDFFFEDETSDNS